MRHYRLKIAVADLHVLPRTEGVITRSIVGDQVTVGTFDMLVFEGWRATLIATSRQFDVVTDQPVEP